MGAAMNDTSARRHQLRAAGFCPIPLFGKTPPAYGKNNKRKGLGGWQQLQNVTPEQIDLWERTWPDAINTGVLTRLMPTLDLDILNEDAVRTIENHVRERYEERGYLLVRIGLPPKRAIPFRTDEPFDKIIANLVAPNGQPEKIEFLGQGQQVVVAGIHPDTNQPYRWFGGEPGQIKLEELPYIREAEARQLVADIVELLGRDFHYRRAADRPKARGDGNGAARETGGAADWQCLFDNIRNGHALHESLRDLGAKLIASGTSVGAAINLLRALMESCATHDARWRERYDDIPRPVENAEQLMKAPPQPLPFINVVGWHGKPVPAREWSVFNRIPMSNVTLFSGEGGVGKSIIALQLAVAVVLGRDWFGSMPEHGAALGICCEDDTAELHRRISLILNHYGASFVDLKGLHLISLAGQDALLATPDKFGIMRPTRLFSQLSTAACAIQPKLIVLDNSADVFGGSENDRAQVRQFIGILRGLAIAAHAGVLLTSHPSLSGMMRDGLSGSTAWNASVRSRLWMRRATTEKDEEPDPDLRVIEIMKANYARTGEIINLQWKDGIFVPVAMPGTLDRLADDRDADELFLQLLDRFTAQGRNASHSPTANNYAPTMFAKDSEGKGKKKEFAAAMERLFSARKIKVEQYDRRGSKRLVRCQEDK
jgi:RecA-family ATPase